MVCYQRRIAFYPLTPVYRTPNYLDSVLHAKITTLVYAGLYVMLCNEMIPFFQNRFHPARCVGQVGAKYHV